MSAVQSPAVAQAAGILPSASLSPPTSSSSSTFPAMSSPVPRKKSFLSSLFSRKVEDEPKEDDSHALTTDNIQLDPLPTPAPSLEELLAAEPKTNPLDEPPVDNIDSPPDFPSSEGLITTDMVEEAMARRGGSGIMTIAELISQSAAHTTLPTTATSSVETSPSTSVGHKSTSSFLTSLFSKKDAASPPSLDPHPSPASQQSSHSDVAPSTPPFDHPAASPASTVSNSSLAAPKGDSRRRSMSEAASADLRPPALSVTTVALSHSLNSGLNKLAAGEASASSSPVSSPSTGTSPSAPRKTSNVFMKGPLSKKESEEEEVAEDSELPHVAVTIEDAGSADAPNLMQQRIAEQEGDASRRRSLSDTAAPEGRQAKLSSHAQSHTAEVDEVEEQKKEKVKRKSIFDTLRRKKQPEAKERKEEEAEKAENEESSPAPDDSPSSSASSTPEPSHPPSHPPSDPLDYKSKMAALVARRRDADTSRRRSSVNDDHSSRFAASAEVNAQMSENNALASQNLSKLQQLESRAAEMEDAADSMLARARKIRQEAEKKSKWSIF